MFLSLIVSDVGNWIQKVIRVGLSLKIILVSASYCMSDFIVWTSGFAVLVSAEQWQLRLFFGGRGFWFHTTHLFNYSYKSFFWRILFPSQQVIDATNDVIVTSFIWNDFETIYSNGVKHYAMMMKGIQILVISGSHVASSGNLINRDLAYIWYNLANRRANWVIRPEVVSIWLMES